MGPWTAGGLRLRPYSPGLTHSVWGGSPRRQTMICDENSIKPRGRSSRKKMVGTVNFAPAPRRGRTTKPSPRESADVDSCRSPRLLTGGQVR